MQDFNEMEQKYVKKRKAWLSFAAFWLLLAMFLGLLNAIYVHAVRTNDAMVPVKLKHLTGLEKEAEDTLDLVVLGNSLSYTSVSTLQLWETKGVAAYNAGHAGQTFREAYETLRRVYRAQKPQVILLEASLLFEGRPRSAGWADAFDTWLSYRFPLYQYHDMWKAFLLGERYAEEHFKGYSLRTQIDPYPGDEYMLDPGDTDGEAESGFIWEKSLAPAAESYLKKMRDLCEDNQSRLILFSTVSPRNYNAARVKTLEEISEKLQVEYLDLNDPLMREAVGIDWNSDSLDHGDHLNNSGAVKVTAYLMSYLENAKLPDHRGEALYEAWDREAAAFESTL